MPAYTIGDGGKFATITAALASGLVHPGDTLALLSGYNTEQALVGIENLTFSGDASNTGIALWLGTGIMAITLTGTAPIAVTGNDSDNSITGNDGSNVLAGGGGNDIINGGAGADTLTGGRGNDIINGGAGADTIYYQVGDGYWEPGDGTDTIDGGPDHDTLSIFGTVPPRTRASAATIPSTWSSWTARSPALPAADLPMSRASCSISAATIFGRMSSRTGWTTPARRRP
jgi:RTX calcium-binding nonapeptide repeat (4 copies)